VEYTPAYSDMWNLYPSDGAANQAKLNYPLGPVDMASYNNGVTKVGTTRSGYGGGSAYVFEPGDEYKGDFARAFFYMATVYDDINWVINYMFQKNTYPTLRDWAVNMLLDWARHDPVSQKEIDRNNVVEQYQGNRNPFVDFPELAEYIWGTRMAETFYLSGQPGSDPTPPITGEPEITQPVNGETLDFGEIAIGESVSRVLQIVGNNLTEPLSLRIVATGDNKGVFTTETTSIPAATMNQNQGYLLSITYHPYKLGTHTGKITLYDGGIDASIVVNLRGESLARPEMGTVTALPPTDLTSTGYTAHWSEAPGIADYYVITRVRTIDGNEESDSYETGETSYTFTDRNAEVAESYYVTYSRLGIMSEASNSVYVAAGSGVEDIAVESPVRIYLVEGGFMVGSDGARAGLRVSDVNGVVVAAPETVSNGDIIMLEQGVYVVTAPGMRPVKVIIK
ncbi:MAG: endonuclease, partial [Muribaculaceae bacterium]|nr:endonuclease [Muribaculaceae bacterium]